MLWSWKNCSNFHWSVNANEFNWKLIGRKKFGGKQNSLNKFIFPWKTLSFSYLFSSTIRHPLPTDLQASSEFEWTSDVFFFEYLRKVFNPFSNPFSHSTRQKTRRKKGKCHKSSWKWSFAFPFSFFKRHSING